MLITHYNAVYLNQTTKSRLLHLIDQDLQISMMLQYIIFDSTLIIYFALSSLQESLVLLLEFHYWFIIVIVKADFINNKLIFK